MQKLLVLLTLVVVYVNCCDIQLSIRSLTPKPFQFQVEIPALKKKTDKATLTQVNQQKKVKIDGPNCANKQWIIRTFKQVGGKWVPAQQHTAKLDGFGRVLVTVNDDYLPLVTDRIGVSCSEGVICARG
ncbi:unnamed protein product [Bursaphelenchus okinawaensis]|uniref:Uncharacterized protein n=1 Tax=Bursaphelenchus okinawaensis TaxID=465554 RepID=A0A811JV24_9BILA|nr:unnamed protein product [Bursaphelenchus okinawaensis]CAG9085172.1 unnamed protein product [Bursaphelenchus okinawaensis]